MSLSLNLDGSSISATKFANWDTIHGWCTVEKRDKLMEIVKELNPKVCVELGVFGGKSLLPVAVASGDDTRIYGVDAWAVDASLEGNNNTANDEWWKHIDYDYMFKYTQDLMKDHGVANKVGLLRMTSREAVGSFGDLTIDLLHQDSNHSEEVSCMEVELYHSKVRDGGIWVFDDTNWETTKKAQALLETKGYNVIFTSIAGDWKVYRKYQTA
jgi:hypothetical protein